MCVYSDDAFYVCVGPQLWLHSFTHSLTLCFRAEHTMTNTCVCWRLCIFAPMLVCVHRISMYLWENILILLSLPQHIQWICPKIQPKNQHTWKPKQYATHTLFHCDLEQLHIHWFIFESRLSNAQNINTTKYILDFGGECDQRQSKCKHFKYSKFSTYNTEHSQILKVQILKWTDWMDLFFCLNSPVSCMTYKYITINKKKKTKKYRATWWVKLWKNRRIIIVSHDL